jgi:hypothetical protein
MRRHLLLVFASLAISYASSITSVTISDDKGCYDYSSTGTTSASSAGFPPASCLAGGFAAAGSGSASAYLTSLSVTGAANDTTQNPSVPFDLSFVTSTASSTQWIVVNGTGSGDLEFMIATDGMALSDTGLASSTVTLNGDTFAPCTIGFGSVSCHGTYVATIRVTYGVPFELDFSMTGNVEGGASLDLSADYTPASSQAMVDIPEPNTALAALFGLLLQLRARRRQKRGQDGIELGGFLDHGRVTAARHSMK